MNEGRTKLLLAILGIVALFAVWQWVGPALGIGGDDSPAARNDSGEFRPMGRAGNLGRTAAARPEVEEVVDLRIAELGGTARDYRPGRDPWRFKVPPPPPAPPPPPPPSAEELERQREAQRRLEEARAAQLAAQAAEAAKPKPPPFTLQYLGKFGPEERPLAVFTDGKNILNVQEGEVIQGKFIVGQIGMESVEIQFVDFPNWPPQRLPVGR